MGGESGQPHRLPNGLAARELYYSVNLLVGQRLEIGTLLTP